MARAIKEIQQQIVDQMISQHEGLSTSKAAEWRLLTYVVAGAIYLFEVVLDLFRAEIEALTARIIPGTEQWYAEMCKRFQYEHTLLYDPKTANLYYAEEDPAARIIRVVSVATIDKVIWLKVAKTDEQENIVPLTPTELYSFENYIAQIRFAGDDTSVVSTLPDIVTYQMEVYYNPVVTPEEVRRNVLVALATFRTQLSFDAMLYTQQLSDAVARVPGVVTPAIRALQRQRYDGTQTEHVKVMAKLSAGYFDFSEDSQLFLTNIKTL